MAEISVLPIWKKDASVFERLSELALYAREHPERFEKFVVAYTEKLPNGNMKIRHMSFGCTLTEEVGLFEIGKQEAMEESGR